MIIIAEVIQISTCQSLYQILGPIECVVVKQDTQQGHLRIYIYMYVHVGSLV